MIRTLLNKIGILLATFFLEKGEFSARAHRVVLLIIKLSLVLLVFDFILAAFRYGFVGLHDLQFYSLSVFVLTGCYLVTRPGSEKNLKEMYRSRNILVKGSFFVAFFFVSTLALILRIFSKFAEGAENSTMDDDQSDSEKNEFGYQTRAERMNNFMMGISNHSPGVLDDD